MNIRQANKILYQQIPQETDPKVSLWWERRNKARKYKTKLQLGRLSKIRKNT